MKRFLEGLAIAISTIILTIGGFSVAQAAGTVLFPSGGGTGTSTNPVYGQILVGNAGGTYTLTATSSLGISSGTINSGTTNRLSYYSGATTLSSANFLSVDATNSFFGDGSTTPYAPLSVQTASTSTLLPTQFVIGSSTLGTTEQFKVRAGVNGVGIVGVGTTSPVLQGLSVNGHGYFTGGIGAGIQNTTNGTIQATGLINTTGSITAGNTITATGLIKGSSFANTNSTFLVSTAGAVTAGAITGASFANAGNTFTVNSSGNVGASTLTVTGQSFLDNSTISTTGLGGMNFNTLGTYQATIGDDSTLGNIKIYTADAPYNGYLVNRANGDVDWNLNINDADVSDNPSDAWIKMSMNTDNPVTHWWVLQSMNPSMPSWGAPFLVDTDTNDLWLVPNNPYNPGSGFPDQGNVGNVYIGGSRQNALPKTALFNDGTAIFVSGAIKFDSSGNIGIGATSPDSKLDVNGTVRFEGASSFETASISGAITGIGCDTAVTTGLTGLASTTAFVTTPESPTGNGVFFYTQALTSTSAKTFVCSDVTVTPTASKYTVKIIR